MEKYQVSARKYRPQTFQELVGQGHITQTLTNAINNDQLGHSFLFCGPRGVGKTSCARILAKVVNTEDPKAFLDDPSGHQEIDMSLNIFELDAASNNGVDSMRELTNQVRMAPANGKVKVYIIDEVHMLTTQAWNAFLKVLEEPPSYVIFILATTEKQKIIPTILSRCQVFDFKRHSIADISSQLHRICEEEKVTAEPEALRLIAEKADGAMRDALTIFDRLVSFTDREITYAEILSNLNILDFEYYFKVCQSFMKQDDSAALLLFDEVLQKGFEGAAFIQGLCSHLRNLLVAKDPEMHSILEVGEQFSMKYKEQAQSISKSFLLNALNIANQTTLGYKNVENKRLQIELCLIKLCHLNEQIRLSQNGIALSGGSTNEEKKTPVLKEAIAKSAPEPRIAPDPIVNPEAVQKPEPKTVEPVSEEEKQIPVNHEDAEAPESKVSEPVELPKKIVAEEVEQVTSKEEPQTTKETSTNSSNTNSKEVKEGVQAAGGLVLDLSLDLGGVKDSAEELPALDTEELRKHWLEYVGGFKTGRTKTCCTQNLPDWNEGKMYFKLASSLEESHIRSAFSPFIENLVLSYPNIDFELDIEVVSDDGPKEKIPYTNHEKYLAALKVNPQLEELKNRLGMKVE